MVGEVAGSTQNELDDLTHPSLISRSVPRSSTAFYRQTSHGKDGAMEQSPPLPAGYGWLEVAGGTRIVVPAAVIRARLAEQRLTLLRAA